MSYNPFAPDLRSEDQKQDDACQDLAEDIVHQAMCRMARAVSEYGADAIHQAVLDLINDTTAAEVSRLRDRFYEEDKRNRRAEVMGDTD